VPTQAERERATVLQRAIDSVLAQEDVSPVPLVIVNGSGRDVDVVAALQADRRLRVLISEEQGLPAALHTGRKAVDTPWFADLDDDDLLLPGALALRVDALQARPDCCAVITNGYRRDASGDVLNAPADLGVAADPLRAMLRQNWLLPGSYLCRSADVGPEVFREMPRYIERTYLALRLATSGPILWLDQPTVVYHVGTPGSESASAAFVLGQADALRRILELPLPGDIRAALRARIAQACHSASEYSRRAGAPGEAFRWHLRSLRERGGWRYLPYTRHLLRELLGI
jgi:hypothetical protein